MLIVGGPGKTQPISRSGKERVFFEGFTDLRGAQVSVRFEDGSSKRLPLVWVTRPIRAAFFVYELPKAHWKLGARPVALVAESDAGKVLARDPKIAGYLRFAARGGLASPAEAAESSRRIWAIIAVVAALLALVAALLWRRRGLAAAAPLFVAAGVTAAFAGAGLARGGAYHAPPPSKPRSYHSPPIYHAYASGYVRGRVSRLAPGSRPPPDRENAGGRAPLGTNGSATIRSRRRSRLTSRGRRSSGCSCSVGRWQWYGASP